MPVKNEMQQALDSISETVSTFVTNQKSMQKQLDAIDLQTKDRLTQFPARESLIEKLKAADGFTRLITERRGRATLLLKDNDVSLIERKTTITETGQGFQTTGVMPIERIPGITAEARQVLTVRDVLSASPTTMALVDFVKVLTPMSIASPVPEASLKPENQLSFVSASEKVRTIATWIPASKQILDDFSELANFISTSIGYYVGLEEELQLLSGDGTGENLHGLIPQAAAFVKIGLPSGSSKIDFIGAAIAQITTAKELPPTFCILNTADYWSIRLLKDTLGRYIMGDPQSVMTPSLFGLTLVPTTSITVGSFLIGSGNPAASEIRDRMEMTVEVSTEHQDFFVKNLVAVRGERRLALVVKRPNSYVTGTFSGSSPA
jgi:HK97 family phage major capsid protein